MMRLGIVLGLGVLASGCSNVTSAAYNRGLWYGRDDGAAVFYCPPDNTSTCYRARFVKAFPSEVGRLRN
ncbi:MAG: hypothetical protein AAFP04_01085 [Myxococcota bacterium]